MSPPRRCGVCPEGLTGNGTGCNDLDECDLADPCDVAATCYNLIPGFRCHRYSRHVMATVSPPTGHSLGLDESM